jgi:hypothetical protein
MGWHTYNRRPRYQAVRYPDGRTTVLRRYSSGNWTRTTVHPNGRKAVTRSTTVGPMTKLVRVAIGIMAPATFISEHCRYQSMSRPLSSSCYGSDCTSEDERRGFRWLHNRDRQRPQNRNPLYLTVP